jgi:hypothetical protein
MSVLDKSVQHLTSSERTLHFSGYQFRKSGKTKQPIKTVTILDLFLIVYYLPIRSEVIRLPHFAVRSASGRPWQGAVEQSSCTRGYPVVSAAPVVACCTVAVHTYVVIRRTIFESPKHDINADICCKI